MVCLDFLQILCIKDVLQILFLIVPARTLPEIQTQKRRSTIANYHFKVVTSTQNNSTTSLLERTTQTKNKRSPGLPALTANGLLSPGITSAQGLVWLQAWRENVRDRLSESSQAIPSSDLLCSAVGQRWHAPCSAVHVRGRKVCLSSRC